MRTSVSVERLTIADDGQGGEIQNWNTILSGLPCKREFYNQTGSSRFPQINKPVGAGVQSYVAHLFIFRQKPAPDIRHGDRLKTPDGTYYNVLLTRGYDRLTFQVDTQETIVG